VTSGVKLGVAPVALVSAAWLPAGLWTSDHPNVSGSRSGSALRFASVKGWVYGMPGGASTSSPPSAVGARFVVQSPPSQLPLQHDDQVLHTSPVSRHMPRVGVVHPPDLQRRPLAQSFDVTQAPPSAWFATQIP
jgi:hypothetical protein